jgi:hypothetical protein
VVGVTAAAFWEFYDWEIEQVAPSSLSVGYTDTVVDLFNGTLGSLTAGGLVLWWGHRDSPSGRSTDVRATA